jgi:hypothetical protein
MQHESGSRYPLFTRYPRPQFLRLAAHTRVFRRFGPAWIPAGKIHSSQLGRKKYSGILANHLAINKLPWFLGTASILSLAMQSRPPLSSRYRQESRLNPESQVFNVIQNGPVLSTLPLATNQFFFSGGPVANPANCSLLLPDARNYVCSCRLRRKVYFFFDYNQRFADPEPDAQPGAFTDSGNNCQQHGDRPH